MGILKDKDGKKKKFVEKFEKSDFGIFIKDKLPAVANKIAGFLPDKGIIGIAKHILENDPEAKKQWAALTPEQQAEYDKRSMDYSLECMKIEQEFEVEITKRWTADMASDSWLSKNARPIILIYSWVFLTAIAVLSAMGKDVSGPVNETIMWMCLAVNTAYFSSRGVEKISQMRNKRKSGPGGLMI